MLICCLRHTLPLACAAGALPPAVRHIFLLSLCAVMRALLRAMAAICRHDIFSSVASEAAGAMIFSAL